MHMTIDAHGCGAGAGTAELTMQLSDFGVPVDVEAPTRGSDRRLLGAHQRRDMTGAVERDVRRAHRTHDV